MRHFILTVLFFASVAVGAASSAQGVVHIEDRGAYTAIAKPGAPKSIVGLKRLTHTISMDTGVKTYGLQYLAAFDDKRPGVSVIGEGYIGMPLPSGCNWYAGGFFDLIVNGKTIGTTPVHSFLGRSSGNRGLVDFVFDAPQALVRIRFVVVAGDDVLRCQVRLEPKEKITSLRVNLRCYPSAFVSHAERHVLTPLRDLKQGEKAELDAAKERWLLYYDPKIDAGQVLGNRTGVGPCAVLWPGGAARKVRFYVAPYGITTAMPFDPTRRELRFAFIDYKGTKNREAIADWKKRSGALEKELAAFRFVDAGIVNWPLEQKKKEIAGIFAAIPGAKDKAGQYRAWAATLQKQLEILRSGGPGAIRAEAAAGELIQKWEKSIPELKLKGLLNGI